MFVSILICLIGLCLIRKSLSLGCVSGECVGTQSDGNPECYVCVPGTYGFGEDTRCINNACPPCPGGTYQSEEMASSCNACPSGSYSNSGSSACSLCQPGQYSGSSAAACNPCPNGTYSASEGSITCPSCAPGRISSAGSSVCLSCQAGKYSDSTAASCIDCTVGMFSQTPGSFFCSSCGPGSFAPSPGSTNCSACAAGKYATGGASTCITCPGGTYSDDNALTCTPCTAGTYSFAGAGNCTECMGGYYSKGGASVCQMCQPSTYSTMSSSVCTSCSPGSASSLPGSTNCTQCPGGTYSVGGLSACNSCPAGTAALPGQVSCPACIPGYYSLGGYSQCIACPAGKYSSTGASTCSDCGTGLYSGPGSSSCSGCVSGTVSDGNSSGYCIGVCPMGTGIMSESSSTSSSAQICASCNRGYYNDGSSLICSPCGVGLYTGNESQSNCTFCSSVFPAPVTSAAYVCESTCPAGSGIQFGSSSTSPSTIACGPCQAGYYQAGSSTTCVACAATQYAYFGATEPLSCSYPWQSYFRDGYHACEAFCVGCPVEFMILACCLLFVIYASGYYFFRTSTGGFDQKLALIMLAYSILPLVDFLSDVWYVFTSQYASQLLFLWSIILFVLPETVYWRGLFLQGVVVKFWILRIPDWMFFLEYDNVFKLGITGLLSIPFIVINSPVIMVHFVVGMVLNSTKIIAVGPLSTLWFQLMTGSSSFASSTIIDTQVLNSSIFSHLFFRTFPHVIVQVINNTYLGSWTTVAKLSILASGLNALNGIYRIIYIKFFLKQDIVDAPIKLTVGGLLPLNYDINATHKSPHIYRSKSSIGGISLSGEASSFDSKVFGSTNSEGQVIPADSSKGFADDDIGSTRNSLIEMRPSTSTANGSSMSRATSAALDFGIVFNEMERERSSRISNPLHKRLIEPAPFVDNSYSVAGDEAHVLALRDKIDKLAESVNEISSRVKILEMSASDLDSVRFSDVSDTRKSRLHFDL